MSAEGAIDRTWTIHRQIRRRRRNPGALRRPINPWRSLGPEGRQRVAPGASPGLAGQQDEAPEGRQKALDTHDLSPLPGLIFAPYPNRGLAPPAIVFRPFGAPRAGEWSFATWLVFVAKLNQRRSPGAWRRPINPWRTIGPEGRQRVAPGASPGYR
jgi:hypothetical protein